MRRSRHLMWLWCSIPNVFFYNPNSHPNGFYWGVINAHGHSPQPTACKFLSQILLLRKIFYYARGIEPGQAISTTIALEDCISCLIFPFLICYLNGHDWSARESDDQKRSKIFRASGVAVAAVRRSRHRPPEKKLKGCCKKMICQKLQMGLIWNFLCSKIQNSIHKLCTSKVILQVR